MVIPIRRVSDIDKKTAIIANAVGTAAYYMGVGGMIIPGATGHVTVGTLPYVQKVVTGATSSSVILGVISSILQNGKVCEKSTILGVASAQTGSASTGPGTDNETYKVWGVEYIPSYIPMEYIADFKGNIGTTTADDGANAYYTPCGISTTSGEDGKILESSGIIYSGARGAGSYTTAVLPATAFFLSEPYGSLTKGVGHFFTLATL